MMTLSDPKSLSASWLITAPEGGPSFNDLLVTACRGNNPIAALLNVFLFEAAKEVRRRHIKKEEVEFIRVTITLDGIIKDIHALHQSVCKKTLIARIKKLQFWEFIQADGYRHRYDIYFRKIADAFINPPPKEQPKPRGRHAHRLQNSTSSPEQDCTFEHSHETTICAEVPDGETTILLEKALSEIEMLRGEIVVLQQQLVKLQQEMVNLQSVQSSERASLEAMEAKYRDLYNMSTINSDKSNPSDSSSAISPDTKQNHKGKTPGQKPKPSSVQQALPELPPDLRGLSQIEQEIYYRLSAPEQKIYLAWSPKRRNVYVTYLATMGYKVPVDITPGIEKSVMKFEEVQPSVEDFKSIAKHAKAIDRQKPESERYYKQNRNLKLWDYVREYVGWRDSQQMEDALPPHSSNTPALRQMTHDEALQLALAAVSQAKQQGRDIQVQATSLGDSWGIVVRWNTAYFTKPETMRSEKQWVDAFGEMCKIWTKETKNRAVANG